MAYASTILASPEIHIPNVPLLWFRLRRPCLSQRTRALVMMGALISPAFLSDQIGYCVMRLFQTADQIAAKRPPDESIMARIRMFHVACVQADTTAAEQGRWVALAEQHRWPYYPEAGPGCFKPDRALLGVAGLTAFNVACPTMALTVADQQRWSAYATSQGWTEYPRAGPGCVDP